MKQDMKQNMVQDMKTTLTRVLTVALLTMVSMGAWAQVKVDIENDGQFKGGTIEEPKNSQVKNDDGTKVTVTLTVTPASGYTITKKDITVVATLASSPSRPDARRNAPEISGTLTLEGDDPADLSKPRNYTVTVDANLGVWVKSATFTKDENGTKATPDYSGTYYIGSVGYKAANTTTNYYLCPTEGWCYYAATNDFTGDDNGMPFLTTYNCRDGVYDVRKAVWTIEQAPDPNDAYYYIKQALTGRYLTSNGTIRTTNNADRLRVHLESVASNDLDDKELFTIDFSNNKYFISPKGVVGGADNRTWLVVNGGNKNFLTGQSGKTGGPTGYENTTGIIGIYTKDDTNAPFYLEPATPVTPAPTITNPFDGTITITGTGTIYYTTDGTEPSTSSSPYSTGINLTDDITVIKAMAKDGSNYESMVVTYELPKCEKPTISVSNGTVTIETTTEGASIRYTTDDTEPTSSSILYSGSFPIGEISTIRAIAVKDGYAKSYEAYYADFKTVTSSSQITRMEGLYRLAEGFTFSSSIGTASDPFTGIIDGQLNVISGLGQALVAYADGAIIKNVILDNVSISGGSIVTVGGDNKEATGAIVNVAKGKTRIYNCGVLATNSEVKPDKDGYTLITSSSSTVSTGDYVGGLVGFIDDEARVINCYSYADITGGTNVGGIVGYNNVATTSATDNQKTMVMNCMFYGEVSGSSIAPIYNGAIITNDGDASGVNNFNYFHLESSYIKNTSITKVYNCALGAETRFLQRFEFFRHLLNSNRELAAWWATGSYDNKDEMMKWVMEPSQIGTSTPYPILKTPDKYYSVVNYSQGEDVYDETLKLTSEGDGGVLHVTIQMGDGDVYNRPFKGTPNAAIINSNSTSLDLPITDKDPEHFNFNYGKVQLPYYNDVGTKNYTDNKVVTGWKIVEISGTGSGTHTFSTGSLPADATATVNNATGEISLTTPYNFADRKCTQKDLYGIGGRIFSQGAYWDVPEGVTAITIEPYWGKAVYLSDAYWDVVYKNGTGGGNGAGTAIDAMTTAANVTTVGGGIRYENGMKYNLATHSRDEINGQIVYTSMSDAIASSGSALFAGVDANNHTVYDYAVVLVGNYHHNGSIEASNSKPYTVTSVDLDGDNEPDYSYILRFNGRLRVHPVRIDFLNAIGLGMAQKTTGGTGTYNFGIMQPKGWFESTNTSVFRFTQFEYDYADDNWKAPRANSPMILQGGVIEQWVTVGGSEQKLKAANSVTYYHVGGNVWFKEFHLGVHQDKTQDEFVTPHPPISVTGGDFDIFYLTGYYNSPNNNYPDNAECYINGGRFGKVAGTGMQGIGNHLGIPNEGSDKTTGNIIWQIDNADIDEFYAGGINAAHIAEGNIYTVITNSRVDQFCGGPKFGDMNSDKKVVTNATNCTFRTFFGAGYGGNSYNRRYPANKNNVINPSSPTWNGWVGQEYTKKYDSDYGGVETRIDYQFLPMSGNTTNVARLFVDYVSFSLATTYDVTSNLTNCTITTSPLGRLDLFSQCLGNFYGGGSLGKVDGDVKSTLINCTVEGNVFGAGYSASLPTVAVMGNAFQTQPRYEQNLGAYLDAVLPATEPYTWEHRDVVNSKETAINTTTKKLFTTENLTTLGMVTGDVTLTINGTTTVAKSVYGGGEESSVGGSTIVTINNGTIGTGIEGLPEGETAGATYGNVYGGGMGKYKDEDDNELDVNEAFNLGLVKGNTNVTINDGTILHNVYGGGAYGSVGTYIFTDYEEVAEEAVTTGVTIVTGYYTRSGDTYTLIETPNTKAASGTTYYKNILGSISARTSGGTANVTIVGGTIGTDGHENGMVFGSSRGDVGKPDAIHDKLAWVHDTHVIIGTSGQGTTLTTPLIKGSVYGSGENGHTYENTIVDIHSGTIGISATSEQDPDGPNYPYRGNVYGGGCGMDMYKYDSDNDGDIDDDDAEAYNPLAGIVLGTTQVNMDGGLLVHNIYGAGAMGSVGTITKTTTDNKETISFADNTGTTTISISGGTVGVDGSDGGNVYGAARGDAATEQTDVALVKTTGVTISGTTDTTTGTKVWGSVYGGGEVGNVHENTVVEVQGGTIAKNVYGGGKGIANSFECEKAMVGVVDTGEGQPLDGANLNNGTRVIISNGQVNGNVYGGGEVGRVEWNTQVTIGVTPEGEGKSEPVIKGNVFGAGAGLETHGYSALVRGNSTVIIQEGATVEKSVYGGGEKASVGRYWVNSPAIADLVAEGNAPDPHGVPYGRAYALKSGGKCSVTIRGTAHIGTDNAAGGTEEAGNVFGAGKGVVPYEGVTGDPWSMGQTGKIYYNSQTFGDDHHKEYLAYLKTLALSSGTTVNIGGTATIKGSVYGGGELGDVGAYYTDADGYNIYPEDPEGVGVCTVTITGGKIGLDNNTDAKKGNVFGAGKGLADNFECDKAMVESASVSITNGTVNGSVFGGGEIGRVEHGTVVAIGDGAGSDHEASASTPIITGNVFGAGAGKETHGYSALVRGDCNVTIQGNAWVKENVYGGGEIATAGRYKVDGGVPTIQLRGGVCTVAVQGHATIGPETATNQAGHVFGAGKGVDPSVIPYVASGDNKSKCMKPYDPEDKHKVASAYWSRIAGTNYVWEYFKDRDEYLSFLETLALVSHTFVTIDADATVKGSVYGGSESGFVQHNTSVTIENGVIGKTNSYGNIYGGGKGLSTFANAGRVSGHVTMAINNGTAYGSVYGGGELGIVKGGVMIDMNGGTIYKDVYGGGALANTNTNNWDGSTLSITYLEASGLTAGTSSVVGYYTKSDDDSYEEASGTAVADTKYYRKVNTIVNLQGGTITGDAYGGGLGQIARAADAEHNITALADNPAYVYGDVTVKLNEAKTAEDTGCSVRRIFGCNNQNGTPKGKVKVYVSATQNKDKTKIGTDKDDAHLHPGAETGTTSTYDVAAVYGGGNLSAYEPADNDDRTEVYIDGCKLTSIKQVYGGGNAACAPATLVHVTGAYEIEELFGGGNGYDDYELYDKYYKNPGANVGYRNYSVLDNTGTGTQADPYGCKDANGTSTLEGRQNYAYGTGIATTEIIGGRIHYVYGGSNKKGNIRVKAKSLYEELDEDCPIVTDETYGGGKDSPMDGMVDLGLGCVNNMEQTFGGSKNADVNSDIHLRITNGTYKQVFGGNNTSGAINGSITVEIKEEGCSPVRIEELYLGGYLAPYSVYGYETDGNGYIKDVYVDENGNNLYDDNGEIIKQPRPLKNPVSGSTPKKDPRIYVISATRIDNIFGGGYKATVVGNPHVNVNMEKGKIDKKYNTTENPIIEGLHEDSQNPKRPYYDYTVETSKPGSDAILAIGTIGNIYGGGNMADIIGNTFVEIGTGYWHNENDVLETKAIGEDGKSYTYTYSESTKKWSCEVTTGEEGNQTTQTVTSDKAPVPARNAATITGNVFGGGKGKADTYECEKAMVGVSDGQDNSIGNTNVIIANGTVGPVDANNKVGRQVDANGIVIGGNVYGGGEVGRVEYNTTVTIGLNPDERDETSGKYVPIIGGDVFGAGAGVETHGYSALVRGDAEVTVQAHAKVNGSVYGGGEKATVGKYWVKGVPYPGLTPPQAPGDLPDFMPYAPRAGGICRVTVKDYAEIGDGTTGGHVFGAGKGVEPHWVYGNSAIDKKYWSRRMSKYDSNDYNDSNETLWEFIKEYTQAEINNNNIIKYVWEYFDTEAKYTTFLETLALASETHVTIGETSGSEKVKVKGSVYGGSENGFVQTDTDVDILSTSEISANVFGGGKGTETHDAAGRVKGNSNVDISGGTIACNVYGGGELGHVGTFTERDGKYVMQTIKDKEGHDMNTGLCTVEITGGKVGPDNNADTEKGNVFGAGKGKDDNFKCDKAMTMNTNVSVSNGTINGNVYGGGEIGRVEENTEVTIGRNSGEEEGNGTGKPKINGSVFGAGRGVATHGYSALVRGNTTVTVEGAQGSTVAESVYGGGEIASVGRYGLDAEKMPEILVDGGICTIKILGYATIGPENASDDKGNVFGAGKGVNPQTFNNTGDDKSKMSRRMTVYNADEFPDDNGIPTATSTGSTWEYYEAGSPFVWEYYQSASAYSKYLETLALATQPHVIIGGNATVNGSVFGGGELGLTKGSVYVNILSGTIVKDVYGGGSLANTNTTSTWAKRGSDGKPLPPVNGVYEPDPTPVHPKTTVNILGGKLRYAYGGGLGQLERAADAANNVTELADIPAKVFGNVKVNLNGLETEDYDEDIHQDYAQAYKETAESPISYYELKNTRNSSGVITSYATGAIVNQIFGCNNLNGSPQKHVKVHVFATQNADPNHSTIGSKYVPTEENGVLSSVYDVEAVYGGGNLAPYEPEGGATTTESTEVIIEGCDLTSIKQVYGGGNAASAPATNVTINSAYEIEEVFGGGNGLDPYVSYGKTYKNPGANVGYKNYTTFAWNGEKNLYEVVVNEDADTKDERLSSNYIYGTGEASVNIYGGRIHRIFGGSNTLGNVRKTAVTVLDSQDPCLLDIDEAYGGGKSASMDAEAKLIMACIPGLKAVYGGAQDADIQDDVVLTITNGTFDRVFGGNNVSGSIHGTITVNIEETGCKPVIIGQLYGGGNLAPYTAPWKDESDHSKGRKDGPTVNVKSFTSIGDIYGGGFGETAVVAGDPYVNVNVANGDWYDKDESVVGDNAKTTGGYPIPSHAKGKIGAINSVFGGGNAAAVEGNTNVNIGTLTDVYVTVPDTDIKVGETEVQSWYTRNSNGGYDAVSTNDTPVLAVANTTYYKKLSVLGVDIRGNVYGGGNNAAVTGNTNVQIGKKAE